MRSATAPPPPPPQSPSIAMYGGDEAQPSSTHTPWLTDDVWSLLSGAAVPPASGGYDVTYTPSIPTHLLVRQQTTSSLSSSSSSASPFSLLQSGGSSAVNGAPHPPSPPPPPLLQELGATNKRPWTADEDADANEYEPAWPLTGLADSVPHGHPLRGVRDWYYSIAHCFQTSPLPPTPLDYNKKPLRFDRFAAHILDPSQTSSTTPLPLPVDEDVLKDEFTITRPAGRSLRLAVTVMPHLHPTQARAFNDGYALIIVCRRDAQQAWQPVCLASFDVPSRRRAREKEVAFAANLESCVDEVSGRRIWGQPSTHVRRSSEQSEAAAALKAVRLQPRGALGTATQESSLCFYVALLDPFGVVLRHTDGSACIACTNTVRYAPKGSVAAQDDNDLVTDTDAALRRELNKLSLFERAEMAAMPDIDGTARVMYITTDARIHEQLGIKTFDSRTKPLTAVALSTYQQLDKPEQIEFPAVTDAMAVRVRAAARQLGWYHADPMLTQPNARRCSGYGNVAYQLRTPEQSVYARDTAWLKELHLTVDIAAVARRAEELHAMLLSDRFCATRTICSLNPYPDRILVDSVDPDMVHCLADTISESEVMLGDRIWALARLAFCVKAPRERLRELVLEPYVEGFCSRGGVELVVPAMTRADGRLSSPHALHPFNGPVLDEEKFYLLLHGMHLRFFRYWIGFHSAPAVRRIHRRLLEEDALFPPSYFAGHRESEGCFTKL